jgi:Protein of unknown function (DUF3187)
VRPLAAFRLLIATSLFLATVEPGQAQGLPEFAPTNPVSVSRSALYFQPYRNPAPGRWTAQMALDYASIVEYNRLSTADYVLDSEVLRLGLELGRDLGSRTFVTLNASLGGAYAGFLDGFLDWYHHALGIKMQERESRPEDQFLYTLTLPLGVALQREPNDLFLNDLRLGFGFRHSPALQSLFTLTLPTATGPAGYGRGVVGIGLLNTWLARLDNRLVYEGSLGGGYTPSHGTLQESQREFFLTASSGLRFRIFGAGFRLDSKQGREGRVAAGTHRRSGARRTGGRSRGAAGKTVLAWVGGHRKEKLLHLLKQELLSLRIPEVQPIVVDELLLHLEPFCPAGATDLLEGATAKIVLEGLKRHPLALLTAAHAMQSRHGRQDRSTWECDPVYGLPRHHRVLWLGSEPSLAQIEPLKRPGAAPGAQSDSDAEDHSGGNADHRERRQWQGRQSCGQTGCPGR